MSYMGIIMSSLRCCILRASVQSTSLPVNYNTQTLGKYISSHVVLIIKHQNLLSQMAQGPFSLHYPLVRFLQSHHREIGVPKLFHLMQGLTLMVIPKGTRPPSPPKPGRQCSPSFSFRCSPSTDNPRVQSMQDQIECLPA
jgi:hypothetical protein